MSSKDNSDYLMKQAQAAGITDPKELANFMGQMQIESSGFKNMDEDLHYSGKRLFEVFPERNGIDNLNKANEIAKGGPEAVANAIYGGKWGEKVLGNKEPGDGWKYHGRGYIQLTGHDRYAEAGTALGLDLVNKPDLAADRENAAKIANWYWKTQVVAQGDQRSVDDATYDINTAGKGLKERRAAAAEWEHKLEQGYKPGDPEPTSSRTLKQGMHDDAVQHAQQELHDLGYLQANPDGRFGPQTKAATEDFQRAQGLAVDGKIGHATQERLDVAVRDKQVSDFNANFPPLRDFTNPSDPQNELYKTLQAGFPPGTSTELLSQATAACYRQGINQPDDLGNVFTSGNTLVLDSNSIFAKGAATVDLSQPPPSVQQTMTGVQQFDQVQALNNDNFQAQQQNLQGPQGPIPGGR